MGVAAVECLLRQVENLSRTKSISKYIVEEKVMQLVWSDEIFGLLAYLSVRCTVIPTMQAKLIMNNLRIYLTVTMVRR